ncbi:MAG: sn-glycerol-3-phosphate ABC transporter ATP-binding protein UgpC [Deltaproteobacteria bacterium]|nr:sn-glycerol-3-phosphate ABC transporter ATP-binding protein UgpC [Deltaproteobacteria bacterium]
MAQVILKDVDKVYEGSTVKVVDRFNLHIRDGEFIVLVGPSGCGKSTTLRMIAGLEDISSGSIQIGDRIVNDIAPKDRDIAMVFQSYALYPHMSVLENMSFGLKLRKVPAAQIDERVQRAASILGIQKLLDRKPRALSGGQRQRVALGRAIVRDPQCFLFDEPLSNLDAKLRVDMRAEIKRLHVRLGSTTVYVTHDQEEAMTLGDRVVVMKDGIIQQSGTALEIYHLPMNRFVAGFLGSPQMNFLEGRLVEEGGQLYFDEGTGRLAIPPWARAQLVNGNPSSGSAVPVGGDVVLGIRPESLAEGHRTPPGSAAGVDAGAKNAQLSMQVALVQPLGDRMNVYLATAKQENIIAQVSADAKLHAGDTVPVSFDMNRAHFFAPGDAGAALALNRERWAVASDRGAVA